MYLVSLEQYWIENLLGFIHLVAQTLASRCLRLPIIPSIRVLSRRTITESTS